MIGDSVLALRSCLNNRCQSHFWASEALSCYYFEILNRDLMIEDCSYRTYFIKKRLVRSAHPTSAIDKLPIREECIKALLVGIADRRLHKNSG